MPTVLRKDGFRVVIYPGDHLPPHVHVLKTGGEVKIEVNLPGQPPVITSVSPGMNNQDVAKALKLVTQNQPLLLAEWRRIHG